MKAILYFTKDIYRFAGNILFFNFIAMLLIGFLESCGIVLLIPLLSIWGIDGLGTVEIPYLSFIIEYVETVPKTLGLSMILAVYVIIIVGQNLFQRHQTILNKKIQLGYIRHLREKTYRSLLLAKWDFFLNRRSSDIVKIMTTEISRVKKGLNGSLQFLSLLVFAGVKLAIAYLLSPRMTLLILAFGLVLVALSTYFIRKSKRFGQENVLLSKIYAAGITEQMQGIKEIKSNTLEETHVGWMRSLCRSAESNALEFTMLKTNSQFLYRTLSAVLLAVFIFGLVHLFPSQPAQLLLVIVIFSRLWPNVIRIQSNLENLAAMVPSLEALIELQQQSIASRELKGECFRNEDKMHLRKGLECQGVCFAYSQDEHRYALKHIDLYIPANRMTAIVGPSGAGKSTLVDVLLGLNQVRHGKVLIDGVQLTDENVVALRRSIGYVPQDPFLFHTTIRENLLLAEPAATEDQLWDALEMSSASEFVRHLPDGLDTVIGDRGVRLSGGEKQRIVLARALLRKPEILILDEATSALDTETEMRVKESLDRLKGSMTIIAIAHRLSTVRNADQVIVMEKGEIVQRGRYIEPDAPIRQYSIQP